jgi:hypothetical protein
LKIRMIPSNWLMQSVFGESGFLRCQSPSIQSPQQLEPPLGTAQALANTRKAKFQWIEERIGIVPSLKFTEVQRPMRHNNEPATKRAPAI